MFNLNYIYNKSDMLCLLEKYFDKDKFHGLCKNCKNYSKIWSCPPYDFDIIDYLIQHKTLYLIGTKIIFSQEAKEKYNSAKKINKFINSTIIKTRRKIEAAFANIESDYTNSVSLYPGSCILCKKCSRSNQKPCLNMKNMRYSLESLGFDVGKISKDLLNTELLWYKETLPDYITLVGGILSSDQISIENYI